MHLQLDSVDLLNLADAEQFQRIFFFLQYKNMKESSREAFIALA